MEPAAHLTFVGRIGRSPITEALELLSDGGLRFLLSTLRNSTDSPQQVKATKLFEDVRGKRLDLEVPADELAKRKPNKATLDGFAKPRRGWERLYVDHVMQADTGADLDFLRGGSGSKVSRESH